MIASTIGAMRGGGAVAVGDGLRIASSGAGGILTPMHRPSVMKGTIGAQRVFLGAVGSGMAAVVAVGAMCVAVCFDHLLDFENLENRKMQGRSLST